MPGRVKIRLLGGLFSLALLTGLLVTALPAAPQPPGFVTRSGDQLLLEGEPFVFTGLNIPNANSDGWCFKALDMDQVLDDIGEGKAVVRAWFFQGMATDDGPGTTARNWARFDATLAAAAAHDVKVIPVLANQWKDCETGLGYKTGAWYDTGYATQVDPEATKTYRDWVAEIVDRYKGDPTIAFWQLINEAEVRDTEPTELFEPPCSANAGQLLHDWAEDISGLIKSIDSSHLVSIGTIGSGQCGAGSSDEYSDLHAIADVDLCEYHDYGSPLVGIPGTVDNGLQTRIDRCNILGKPIFVGEAGIIPNNVGGTLDGRAAAFRNKIDAQFAAGVRGFLAWAYVDEPSFRFNHNIDAGDPALQALAEAPWRLRGLEGFAPGVFVKNASTCNSDGSGTIDYTATHPVSGPMSGSLSTTGVITLGAAGTDDRSPILGFTGSFTFIESGGETLTGTLDWAPARQSSPYGTSDFMNQAYCASPFYDAYFQLTARFIAGDGTGATEEGFAKLSGAFSRSISPSNFASTTFWVAPELSVQVASQIDEAGLRGSSLQPPVDEGGLPLTISVFPAPIDDLAVRVFTPNYTEEQGNTDTTDAGSDYTAIDQVIVIPGNAGSESRRSVPIVITLIDDVDPEILESLSVHIELISGAAYLKRATHTGFVTDNDTVTLSFDDVTIAEGNAGEFGDVGVTAVANGAVANPVYGCVAHSGGTATESGDYSLSFDPFDSCETATPAVTGAPFTLNPPASSALVNIATVFGDDVAEYDETIDLAVDWIWGATLLGGNTVTITILDDEEHDLDDDGVDDRIGTGTPGAFDDGTTNGVVVTDGGLDLLIDDLSPGGVRITVPPGGSGTAQVTMCTPPGFTLSFGPGTDVIISCGSVIAEVLAGFLVVELSGGNVLIPEGGLATVSAEEDGSYTVENNGDVGIEVTLGGVTSVIGEGGSQAVCSALGAPSVAELWPVNHTFSAVDILVTDAVLVVVDSIYQDEPVNGPNDGNTSPDGQGVGTATAQVRAERAGNGNGRVYHIGFTATDASGDTCSGVVTVGVPISRNSLASDDGALYDSTSPS